MHPTCGPSLAQARRRGDAKGGKQAVSRVLFPIAPPSPRADGAMVVDHLSRATVTGGLQRRASDGAGDMANPCSAGRSPGLAPGRGLPSRHLSMPLVRSYRTFAPLPDPPKGPSAVCFCGTVLTVSRTGRYPAGLAIGEPGLSSTGSPFPPAHPKGPARGEVAGRDHLTCFPGLSLGGVVSLTQAGNAGPQGRCLQSTLRGL